MKSNLVSLINVSFKDIFVGNTNNKKKKNTSFIVSLVLYAILLVFLSLYFGAVFSTVGSSTRDVMTTLVLVATFMIFTQSTVAVKKIFISQDYDILMSLPIKKSDIIISKSMSLVLQGIFNSTCLLLPCGVLRAILDKNLFVIFDTLLECICTPILPLSISIIFGTIFSYISAHAKKFSGVIDLIFNLLLILVIFAFSFSTSYSSSSGNTMFNSSLVYIGGQYYFMYYASNNPLYYLAYVGISIALVVFVIYFVSLFYVKVHELLNKTNRVKYVRHDSVYKSKFRTCLKNETIRLFKTKAYALNFVITVLFGIGFSIFLSVQMRNTALAEGNEEFKKIIFEYGFFMALCPMYFIGVAVPAQGLINLEGKAFYLNKTLPIDRKTWIKSKLVLSLLITVPACLISSIVIVSLVPMSIGSTLIVLFVPTLSNILDSIILLHLNLINPKLDAKDEQQMAKQSSGFLPILFDMGLMVLGMIIVLPGAVLNTLLNGYGTLLSFIIALIAYSLCIYFNLKGLYNNVDKNVERIDC
ncbi:MAG: hypothetical protein K6G28_02505 [Acholeplasmatales bacterium]|nr:hypothetical protein [Acholeplasmatales bacterium]